MKDHSVQSTDELITFSEGLADSARSVALKYFRNQLDVEHKADASPVTIADRAIESIMRDKISSHFPDHGIFGEEHGRANIENPEIWVLDPIDGTKSFITGMPTFGTLIAFLNQGRPVIGIIDMPALKERWIGVEGKKTTLNTTPCTTRQCDSLAKANLYSTSIDAFNETDLKMFDAISSQAALRRFGGDCYSYGLLASGHVDVVLEASLAPYDYLALVPIVEGAGGIITDWHGNALGVDSDGRVLASATQELHDEVLMMIRSKSF